MSQKLYARAKGWWNRLRRTPLPHGPSPAASAGAARQHHPPSAAAAPQARAHAHAPAAHAPVNAQSYAQPLYARAATAAANAHATATGAVLAPRAGAYVPAPAAVAAAARVSVATHAKAINASVRKLNLVKSAAVTNPHAFITDGSSLTEVVLCRHTREATLVSTPARPDVEFESPRSDALASYRAFMAALNAKRDNGHRRHTRSSFQGHFGAFGLLSAVGAILSNTDKAKAEGKDKDQKERKAFKTLTDIFSTLKKEKSLSRDSKPWSKHDDVSISSYFPASINPHARARAKQPDAPNPKAPAQTKVETVAAPAAAVSSANSTGSTGGSSGGSAAESKCNKENVEPQQLSAAAKAEAAVYSHSAAAASSSSSDAAADLAAAQQMLRLNGEEQKVLDEARAYYDQKVDADGALVLGRDDISPSKWQGLALYLTCTSTVQSLRLQNVDIDAEAARVLGATKRYARSLRHVTLCDNGIGTTRVAAANADAGAAAAAAAAVSALDPNECLNALIDFLLRCILLESLAILRNSVRDQHVPSLQRLLVQHRSLMRLSLCWNGIADSGAKALAKAIETYASNLREIDLSYNSVSAEARSYVEQCAHHHVLRCGRETRFRLEHNRAPGRDLIGVG